MISRPLNLRSLLPPALAFLGLHAISLVVFPSHTTTATYPFLLLAPCAALFACWRARAFSRTRLPWILLSAGLLLWIIGTLLSIWEELFRNIPFNIAFFSDFAYFLYGVPILLAISSSTESPAQSQSSAQSPTQDSPSLFLSLDAIQALLTAYLTYITLFHVLPFATTAIHPISDALLMRVYNVENLVLAVAATLRLLAQPRHDPNHPDQRRFFQILCLFLWTYALCASLYNYASVLTDAHTFADLFVDVPFLLLAAAAILPAASTAASTATPRTRLALFFDAASPIFYTLALLALGATIARQHFAVGITAILVALAVYGIRTTTLQSRLAQSQLALQQVRDQLQEMSLKDSLTDIANRRCFDQILDLEWGRALRTQHPLALLLIDIDFFKNLNDRYGHRYGDQCLAEIAAALGSTLPRSSDLLARYGGEEFAAILPETDLPGAKAVADRMQEAVRSLRIPNQTPIGNFATVSIGVAVYEFPQAGDPAALIEASDRGLYKAKQSGRDRTEHVPLQAFLDAGSFS
ncbi:MAG TPA: diguanylate cyclase [Granulicella sp.]|jgi:diguanylate cyclase (GGDEF)-like protein|nr:diguanylate cyclase [Granulicella sp.]